MELPQESALQKRLEENRRAPAPKDDFAAALARMAGKKPVARPQSDAPAFELEPEGPPPDRYSFGGFAENVLNDAFGLVKGLYQMIPTTAKAAYDILSDPAGMKMLLDNPSLLASAFGDTAVAVKDAIIEPYQKHGLAVGYHKPITVLLDALTVNGLIAGGVKAAGRVAAASGSQLGEKLIQAGSRLERLPAEMTRSIVDKGVLKLSGGKWDLAKRREYLAIKAEEASQIPLKIAEDYKNAGKKVADLTDEEAALWDKWRKLGYSNADAAAHPKVAEALESYRQLASIWNEGLKARGLLDDARAEGALVKKYAAEAFGNIEEAALKNSAERIAEIRKIGHGPVYGPAIFEQKGMDIGEMVDRFIDMGRKSTGGKTNFLEEYTGKAGAIKDPRIYVPEAIKNFRHVEGRLRFDERILQNPQLTLGPAGVKKEALPMGVLRKHFDSTMRARAFDAIADPTIKRLLKLERNISPDPLRVVLNIYDKMLNLWRKSATSWNPAYYTGNVIGDAVLGTLAGSDWTKAQTLVREGAMAPQGMARVGMAPTGGYVERLKDVANAADQAARAGIITRQVAKSISENAAKFEKAGYSLDSILRSTQQLSDTQVQMQLLQEHIARTDRRVVKTDSIIGGLLKQEKQLADRIKTAGVMAPGSPQVEALNRARQRIVNITKLRDDMVRDLADSAMKESGMEARIPGLREQNDVVRQAVRHANDYIGDYLGLDGFEQGVMRRAMPFYPFVKAMNMLAFKLPFINPVKTFLWNRYSMAAWSMVGDP